VGLVLLDWFMPGVHGQEALAQIRTIFENASVVVMSGEESPQTVWSAIELGASGYIPKSTDTNVTIHALRLVLSSGIYLPPVAIGTGPIRPHDPVPSLAGPDLASKGTGAFLPASWSEALSPRQKEVLHCVLQGKPNKVIAREIGIAEGTVKAHLWAVFQLLGVKNRVEAMRLAYELKLVE
jgi:DNA-binding NarL/FixJ family response regulator